jgi:hypothetical protein
MSDPRRWKDGAAPPEVRELLGASRRTRTMTSAERRRTAGRVANLVSVPVAASLVWVWAKGVAIAGVATLSAVTLVHVSSGQGHAPSMFASAPAAAVRAGVAAGLHQRGVDASASERLLAPPSGDRIEARVAAIPTGGEAAAAVSAAEPTAAVPRPRLASPPIPRSPVAEHTTAPAASAPAAAAPPDTLEKEANLLEAARGVLAGDPARALALLDRHATEFPRGQLVAERGVLRIDALRRLGRLDEARSDGRALDGEARIYAPRVQKMIDTPRQ